MTQGSKPKLTRRLGRRALQPALSLSWKRLRAASARAEREATHEHDLAAVFVSFDGYQRFWPPLRHFTAQHLDDEVPRYWVSETVPIADEEEGTQVLVGPDRFIPRVRKGIERVPAHYILLVQEDIWFDHPISVESLESLVSFMKTERLDGLKLGWSSYVPDDRPQIDASTSPLAADPRFRWFGPNPYSMSHHASIFRTSFFLDTCRLAEQVRITDGLRHEQFISSFFEPRIKAHDHDDAEVRVAVWNDEPVISYAHAGWQGKLTPEGRKLLAANDLLDLYDHSQDGADPPRPR